MSCPIDQYWTSENFFACNFSVLLTHSIANPKSEKIILNTINYV